MSRLTVGLALACALVAGPRAAMAQAAFSSCPTSDVAAARFRGNTEEPVPDKPGMTRTRLSGDVVIPCGDMTLFADEVVFDKNTNIVEAFGHVYLQQKDMSLYGDHAVFDRVTRMGTFYNAWGFAQMGEKPAQRSMFGTLEPDVWFWGTQIERIGEKTYRLTNGGFTTCVQPSKRWEMTTSKGTFTLDKRVFMRSVVLKVKDVPMLYLPAMYYPINKEGRSTGFLMPQYGSSTYLGTSLSNAFFWAINRSQDATLYYDWYSQKGKGYGTEYRYVSSPGSQGTATINVRNTPADVGPDGTIITAAQADYTINGNVNQALPHNFRVLGNVQYFTSVAQQQEYQNIDLSSSRTRQYNASLNGNVGLFRIAAIVNQTDYFNGTTAGQRVGQSPSLSVTLSDRPIGKSKIYFGVSGAENHIIRQDDLENPLTNRSLWRFDGGPRVSATFSSLPFLSATASAALEYTHWSQSIDPSTSTQVGLPISRQLLTTQATLTGPTFVRIFQTPKSGYAERFKHVIEPSLTITHTSPFALEDRVVQLDGVDTVTGGNTTVNYQLRNSLLAKRKGPNGTPGSAATIREILTVTISQSYYTVASASQHDPEYQQGAEFIDTAQTGYQPSPFSPLQVSAIGRPTDLATAQFTMSIDPKARTPQTISLSGGLDSKHGSVNAGWRKQLVVDGNPSYIADYATDSLNATTTLKTIDNRIGGTYLFSYDVQRHGFVNQRILVYYNSQCCGLSVDWQSFSAPLLGVPSDKRLAVSFTLAGLGSFSNPLGSFGAR